jgi:hypothetical protein
VIPLDLPAPRGVCMVTPDERYEEAELKDENETGLEVNT